MNERRVAILEASMRLLESEGPGALTMRRLAEEMGFTPPILYDHFAGKAELLAAIADLGFGLLHEAMGDDASMPPSELGLIARRYVEWGLAHQALYDVMVNQPSEVLKTAPNAQAAFTTLLEVVSEGTQSPDTSEARAKLAWASLHGIVSLAKSGVIEREWLDTLVDTLTGDLLSASAGRDGAPHAAE